MTVFKGSALPLYYKQRKPIISSILAGAAEHFINTVRKEFK